MSRTKIIEREQQIHQRIIARLYALAALCERAAGMPALIRFMVLWLLRGGEGVARDYAQDIAYCCGGHLEFSELPDWQDSSPEGAICLAQQFRALADILQMLTAYFDFATQGSANDANPDTLSPVRGHQQAPHNLHLRSKSNARRCSARGPPQLPPKISRTRFLNDFSPCWPGLCGCPGMSCCTSGICDG